MDRIEERVARVEAKIENIEESLKEIKGDIKYLKNHISDISLQLEQLSTESMWKNRFMKFLIVIVSAIIGGVSGVILQKLL